jgi:Spy/CpxP family protein refolding chaperone
MKPISIALAAALSLAAGASFAQTPQPAPGQAPPAEGRHWQRPDPAQMAERHAQRLRDALQLRPDQEPALRQLVTALQPPAGERERLRQERGAMAQLTTPQRLDRMAERMNERAARFRQHADAIKRFYAQLTPAQQKAFDAMPMMGMGGHHGMGGRGGGGPGMNHRGMGGPHDGQIDHGPATSPPGA